MKKRTAVILTIVAVIVGSITYVGYVNFIGSADGTIKMTTLKPEPSKPVSKPVPVTGTYADFQYPNIFTSVRPEAVALPVLERFSYIKTQHGAWILSIQVSRLSTGSLDDDGSYHFRDISGSRFDRDDRTIGQNQVIIFSDANNSPFDKVAYLHHGNLDASIALNGGLAGDNDQMQMVLDDIVGSWQWQ